MVIDIHHTLYDTDGMKTILVTGGAGFLGSHLCDSLIERGDTVVCLDNFFTGQEDNVAHLIQNPCFQLLKHDVINPIALQTVDQIYNLACPASPIHYQYNPIKTVQTSTIGVINILDLAKRTNARMLQFSTSEIYGDPTVHPQPETYVGNVNCLGTRACYDEGKRVAETLCMDYHRMENVDIRIVRIFNTYGPRTHLEDGRVVSNFITQALRNDPITLYGNGSQTRSFCYVDDLIEAIIRMMNQNKTIGPVNIGNPAEITIKELAEKIIHMTKSNSRIEYHTLPTDDPKQRQPDITLAKEMLDWNPTTPLEEGLLKTIEYFRQKISTSKRE